MARYPFREKAEELLVQRSYKLSEVTVKNLRRRYAKQEREFIKLYEAGEVSTLAPSKFTIDDIRAYLTYRVAQKKSSSDQAHDISALDQLCLYCGNPVVKQCLGKYPDLKPNKSYDGRLDPLPIDVVRMIHHRAAEVDPSDFRRVRAYALVILYIATGARNKEIRLAELGDLDTANWRLTIRHPKGEDTYGATRTVPVPASARPIMVSYLNVREEWLLDHGLTSRALFFAMDSDHGALSSNSVRYIKRIVEDDIGVSFELRDCRRTFGQTYLDLGLDLEDVSVLMGHHTTKTTEKYYCRRSADQAVKAAEDLMRRTEEEEKEEPPKRASGSRTEKAAAKTAGRPRR